MKGKVTRINGNPITITDDKGKKTTVEGSVNDIKVGDAVRCVKGSNIPTLRQRGIIIT